ncbi:hypothetical protein SAMN04489760_1149 [Syntrophus gentianae]|uniref:Uncharacterized protein n=1 Tax=Syntrophus gentianae TaxID=43775 RepID=A0A1H7Y5Y9_9BACT|nr:hypothetical protein SAMN04489760_1149 [Syntrophus gentianae]
MGKSMYDYVNRSKERARQQKQIDKASERIRAKQENTDIQTRTPNAVSDMAEQGLVEEIVTRTA